MTERMMKNEGKMGENMEKTLKKHDFMGDLPVKSVKYGGYVYQEDQITLNTERITEYTHPVHGLTTVFHDAVIASEIVHEYPDGKAWKSRDELKEYAWTVDGRWVMIGGHPQDAIISDRSQVNGRTVNPRYVKDLQDPKTKRPNRAGVRADIEVFNEKTPPETLKDMKNGKKSDVSIGFFYHHDASPGTVEDGPFKGVEYDYVQRNMFHDHLAAGIDDGRCPSPYCGLGVDEIRQRLSNDPFAGFPSWGACISHMTKPKKEGGQGYTEEQAERVCGKLKAEHEDTLKREKDVKNAMKIVLQALYEAMEELNGVQDAIEEEKKTNEEWWKLLDWKEVDRELWEALPDETRQLITDEGLCPECSETDEPRSEAERAMSHYKLSEEEWAELSDEEKQELIDKLPERGSGEEDELDLPYEDGDALEFTLTPVEAIPDEKTEEKIKETKEKQDEVILDPYEVLARSRKILEEH